MSPSTVITERAEFRNDSGHVIGVVTRRAKGEMKGLPLQPGDSVWLDEEEQIATANAPRSDADNPFANGDLKLVTEPQEIVNRRQIGYSEHRQVGDLTKEPSDPAAGSGSSEEAPPAPPQQQDGDVPPEPPQTTEEPKGRVPEGKVAPGLPGAAMTPEQEAQAKAAAARAVKTATTTPQTKQETPAKAPEGARQPTEEVGTPEAQGK
jgi:hypothetical protein